MLIISLSPAEAENSSLLAKVTMLLAELNHAPAPVPVHDTSKITMRVAVDTADATVKISELNKQVAQLPESVRSACAVDVIHPDDNPTTGVDTEILAGFGQPVPQPLTGALSTAGAGQLLTAPVVPPVPAGGSQPIAPVPPAPTPVSAGPVPPAPVAQANPVLGVEVDSKGLPWDARIHAGTKTKNADGSWRALRGLNDPALVQQVEAELRQTASIPAPVAPVIAPNLYGQFITTVTQRITSGSLTIIEVNDACTKIGLPDFPSLATRPDLVPNVASLLGIAV